MNKAYIKTEESGMHYVYILPKMLDSKYWYYDKQIHYTKHMYRNSPYETDSDCGNCDGAACDYCNKIVDEGIFNHGVECNILESWLIEAGVPEDIAIDAVYNDFYKPNVKKYRIIWPNERMLKEQYPEDYKRICNELGYVPKE